MENQTDFTAPGAADYAIPDVPQIDLSSLGPPPPDLSGTAPGERPRVGESLPNEPSRAEIIAAATNQPSEKYKIILDGEEFPLVELTSSHSLTYLDTVAVYLEDVGRKLGPLVKIAAQTYSVWRNYNLAMIAEMREFCRTEDLVKITAALEALGIENPPYDDVVLLQNAARGARALEWMLAISTVVLRPVAGPAVEALQGLSFSGAISELGRKVEPLAYASLASSLVRRRRELGLTHDELEVRLKELREQMELLDVIDQFTIAYQQLALYHDRGKLGSFFVQGGMLTMPNTLIGMLLG